MTHPAKNTLPPASKRHIRPALRQALSLIVTEGLSISDAAQRVGMVRESLSRALMKEHVQLARAAVKRAWLASETSKAWVTVAYLANNAQSEDVKLKAAKVILDAAGELDRGNGDGGRAAGPTLNIILHHPAPAGVAGGGNGNGVIEMVRAPARGVANYEVIEA